MMCEHLGVVFSALFDVDDDDLLEPKGELNEVVPFCETGHFAGGEVGPEGFEREKIGGGAQYILQCFG